MTHNRVRVEARVRFLTTAEGGRSSSIQGGGRYGSNHNFFWPENRDMCIGFIELDDGEQVTPGDTIEKTITLLVFPAVEPEIRRGKKWRLQEGNKLVATGIIVKVHDLPG
jgi:translation elongation factor EF-Tu-like GTPase